MVWSHEHKAHFKAKVKHIVERMIRRFGVEVVEKNTPEADRKLIANIRKTRERRKKKGKGEGEESDEEDLPEQGKRKGKFESEFDEAIYGSEDDESVVDGGSDNEAAPARRGGGREKGAKSAQTYIVEDEDEPLDLLDRKALGNISSTRPLKAQQPPSKKKNAKVNVDGKLVIGEDDEDEEMADLDGGAEPGDGTLEGGINAYVDAIRGKDAARRGQKGKLKFSNKRDRGDDGDGEVDEEVARKIGEQRREDRGRGRGGFRGSARGGRGDRADRGGSGGRGGRGGR
ncbi:hypothetical protein LTS18_002170, partial [Coniosporium uncinatum]